MFKAFSFNTSRSPSLDSDASTSTVSQSRSISPCSTISPWPTPRYSITDLTADFRQQKLRGASQIYSRPCDAYANVEDDAGWTVEEQETADLPPTLDTRSKSARSYSPVRRRLERQAHSKLLCSAAHHRDIAMLVSRMLRRKDQCMVQPPTSISCPPTSEAEADDTELTSVASVSSSVSVARRREARRTSDLHKTGASISKDARRRKEKPKRRRSADD